MRWSALVAIAAIAATLAGCSSGGGPEPPAALPPDWDRGREMLPYSTSATHAGGYGVDLYPEAGASSSMPFACKAYRTDEAAPEDKCEVRAAKYRWEDRASWVVVASWSGCEGGDFGGCHDEPYPDHGTRRVVAFDARGDPAWWWAGRMGPDTMHATE